MLLVNETEITVEPGEGRDTTTDVVHYLCRTTAHRSTIENNLEHQPPEMLTASASLGIKESGSLDFTVVLLPQATAAAGVFTKNLCPGYCISHNRNVLKNPNVRALAVNSGNANVFTSSGKEDLQEILSLLEAEFGVPAEEALYCSTGVIGVSLPMEKFRKGIPGLSKNLQSSNLDSAAEAILTTDLGAKVASTKIGEVVVCGIAKGAGMIEPNMATMLSFFFTNIDLPAQQLQALLEEAVESSFNSISVDSDTSTSDAVSLHSTGTLPVTETAKADFRAALQAITIKLAKDVISQGEGVTKIIEARVSTDISQHASKIMAKTIINSPLVKTAVHGADPNWGRIVMAIGKPHPEIPDDLISQEKITISIQNTVVYNQGKPCEWSEQELAEAIKCNKSISIKVNIGGGDFEAHAWGCDLSAEYVRINAEYTT